MVSLFFRVGRRLGGVIILVCGVLAVLLIAMSSGTVMFVQLLRAIGAFEFMALAGYANQGNSHKKDRE
jgi:hypothetical protein